MLEESCRGVGNAFGLAEDPPNKWIHGKLGIRRISFRPTGIFCLQRFSPILLIHLIAADLVASTGLE